MPTNNNKDNIDWNNVIKKEVIGIDGLDLGEVHEVGDTYIITQKGLINKKRYHIPISSVESFDGDTLNVRVSESELKGFEEKLTGAKNLKDILRLNLQICQKNLKQKFL